MKRILVTFFLACLAPTLAQEETLRYVKPENTQCSANISCFTLSEILQNTTLATAVFSTNSIVVFLRGQHVPNVAAFHTIRDVENLTLLGSPDRIASDGQLARPASEILCTSSRFAMAFVNVSRLTLTNITFSGCGTNITSELANEALPVQTRVHFIGPELKAALLLINVRSFRMAQCSVLDSYGYGLLGINVLGTDSLVTSCIFLNNNGYTVGLDRCSHSPRNLFDDVTACSGGNALFVFEDFAECPTTSLQYSLTVQNSVFALGVNGFGENLPDTFLTRGGTGLGVVLAQSSYGVDVTVDTVASYGNTALIAANLYVAIYQMVDNSTVWVRNSEIQNANRGLLDVANIFDQSQSASGGMHVEYNMPFSALYGTPACSNWRQKYREEIVSVTNTRFTGNVATLGAGAFLGIRTSNSEGNVARFRIQGCTFSGGVGISGTALYIAQSNSLYSSSSSSQVTIEDVSFVSNKYVTPIRNLTALYTNYKLNAIQLIKVQNVSITNCSFYGNEGSALSAFGSNIFMSGVVDFDGNSAISGGGLDLESSSIILVPHTRLLFRSNYALLRGGAISIVERGDIVLPCFFQISDLSFLPDPNISISLRNNYAEEAGSVLFGGSVDLCYVLAQSSLSTNTSSEVFNYLFNIGPHVNTTSLISSEPSVVCICLDGQPNCLPRNVRFVLLPGATLVVPFATVGLRNGTTPSSVYVIMGPNTTLGRSQEVQSIGKTCTDLNFTIKSMVSLDTGQSNTGFVIRTSSLFVDGSFNVSLEFLPCPEGFVLDGSGECVCDPIEQFGDFEFESCNISAQTVRRPGGSWMSPSHQGPNGSYDGVVVFLNCPYDYCSSSDMDLDLSDPDSQCNFNRTGVLCGACKPGLSVRNSSSRCVRCSNYFILLVILYFFAGILLVVVLFLLNLTITQGTLGGVIFYANILAINRGVFYPPGRTDTVGVILSWINLDIGVDTCFYDGLDGYGKIWFGFVFPIYIWLIVSAIIIASRFSPALSRLCGSKSVPVLATMMLLAYSKLLRIVIVSLSSTELTNPDGSDHVVWTFDGNLDFFVGKHAALGAFALAVLLFFIVPYTLLLVLVPLPCIQARSAHRLLSWVNKLKPFFDAHQGPFRNRFRNWTGVLLLARVVLSINSGLNLGQYSNDRALFVIALVVLLLLVVAGWTSNGGLYKKWLHNLFEVTYYVNLMVVTLSTMLVRQLESGGDHQLRVYLTSGWIAVVELGGIVVYHAYLQLSTLKAFKERRGKFRAWIKSRSGTEKMGTAPTENELVVSYSTPSSSAGNTTISFHDLREPLLDDN